ncbi:MAG: SMP-30/gluconolactonase/LRE family protein [Rhodoferax sp.]|nr:SMP-30/gluconolactonase/LRE family protein [Rhodoferax sp.]
MQVQMNRIEASRDKLGEGALWDSRTQCLYWVDSVRRLVRRLDPGSGHVTDWVMPGLVGSVALMRSQTQLLAALNDGWYLLDLDTGAVTPFARPSDMPHDARLNDGKTDRQGRFLVGTILEDPWSRTAGVKCAGILYRLNADRSLEQIDDDIRLSNATCFSPAGDKMYFADSPDCEIRVYDYDGASGRVAAPRTFIDTRPHGSLPDGATVDSDGCLWVALPQIAAVGQFDPQGALMRTVKTPCPLPTCPSFGGADLDELYVTSLHDSGNGRLLSPHPDSGFVFRITGLGVRGLPEVPYAG